MTTAHALQSPHKLKLGCFGLNVDYACAASKIDGVFRTDWSTVKAITARADKAGFDALVPVARWRGFGGDIDFNGACYETFTWAAGLAEATRKPALFSTCHVPTIHPIVAAKQGTTIDHISGGRFALNIVTGWYEAEMEMFGAPLMEHEERYRYADEWLQVLKLLWTRDDEFDFEGKHFNIKRGYHLPKPIQKPFPPVMNAGGSMTGRHFAAKNCDMIFVHIKGEDIESARKDIDEVRKLAREEYGREIQVWANTYCVLGDSDNEAFDFRDYYVKEQGDWVAIDNLVTGIGLNSKVLPPHMLEAAKYHFIAGFGGYPLVGTKERIASEMVKLSEVGLDGALMSWPRYEEGITRFIDEVMPLLVQVGLRAP